MELTHIRRLLSKTRCAVDDYSMINEGDRIAVGVSGGKDSLALLCALHELSRFYPKHFSIVALTVDLGFEGADNTPIEKFCAELGIPYHVEKTSIADIIFKTRKESNPCSLCARMRRGVIHDAAKALGCNKIALGHHYDDLLDTFLLNLFYEGRLGSFRPVTYLDRKDVTVIRPFVLAAEKDIRYFVSHNEIPVLESLCPEDKHTERENVKKLRTDLEKNNKGLSHRLFCAIKKANLDGYGETETK